MKNIQTQIEIFASASEVWKCLTDFGSFPKWNPFIRRIEGVPAAGQTLTVRIEPPGGRPMTFRPTVLRAEPGRELRWIGRFLMPGLFDGEHSFRIEAIETNRVRLHHSESFTGLLVPLLWGSMEVPITRGFGQMNEALRKVVEEGRAAPA